MIAKQISDLTSIYKVPYRIKVRMKRLPAGIDWEVIEAVFDEITRNRMILKATRKIPSSRMNNAPMIIRFLHHFSDKWPLYVYFKDKVITLPVIDIKIDDENKAVWLIV